MTLPCCGECGTKEMMQPVLVYLHLISLVPAGCAARWPGLPPHSSLQRVPLGTHSAFHCLRGQDTACALRCLAVLMSRAARFFGIRLSTAIKHRLSPNSNGPSRFSETPSFLAVLLRSWEARTCLKRRCAQLKR